MQKRVQVPTVTTKQKGADVPQAEVVDQAVEVPVQEQVQTPIVMKVQKHAEASPTISRFRAGAWMLPVLVLALVHMVDMLQVEGTDQVVDVPQKKIHVPTGTKVQKEVQNPQVENVDRTVETPVQRHELVPMVMKMQKCMVASQQKFVGVPQKLDGVDRGTVMPGFALRCSWS